MGVPSFLNLKPVGSGRHFSAAQSSVQSTGGGLAPPAKAKNRIARFVMQKQEQTQWCWAAVSVSHALFYDPGAIWTQCAVACAEKGGPCCDAQPAQIKPCNHWHYLESALARVGIHRDLDDPVPFATVRSEIDGEHPLPCRVGWWGDDGALDGSGHFVTLSGWALTSTGAEYVDVEDPWYQTEPGKPAHIEFAEFESDYRNQGEWTHSYVRPGGGGAKRIHLKSQETRGG